MITPEENLDALRVLVADAISSMNRLQASARRHRRSARSAVDASPAVRRSLDRAIRDADNLAAVAKAHVLTLRYRIQEAEKALASATPTQEIDP